MGKRAKKPLVLGCTIAAISMMLLSACQSGKSNEGPEATPEKRQQVPAEPTELYFLSTSNYWWDEEVFMRDFGEPLKKKFPNIIPKTVKLTAMNAKEMEGLIASKQPMDVILAANYSYLSLVQPYGLSEDIEPYLKQAQVDLNRFAAEFLDLNRSLGGGKLIGLPLQDSPTQVLYNKSIFDKFGVPYPPHDRWTWDEMFTVAKKLTRMDGDTSYYGVRVHPTFFRRNPYSLEFVHPTTHKVQFNSDLGKTVSEMFLRQYELSDTKGLTPYGDKLFFEDRTLAMWMGLGSSYNTPERYKGLEWDLAPIPILPERGNVSVQPYPDYMYLSSISKHKELAVKAMDFFTSDYLQMELSRKGWTTPLKNSQIKTAFGQDSDLFRGKNVSAMSPAKYAPAAAYDLYIHQASATIIPKHIHNVALGQTDINSAMRSAEEEVNKFIEAQQSMQAK
ncbi:carbohydrate ABC transporter substrate-binding protein [Paenibacillus mesophilus]|uniref:ABC transporter substrate-binding protein n=1 Tax=Paenibacillus mesophilus TaxID=2582849 RepID=UPI00110F257E|nr:ABC transporter substrate-binding protein [Paenibacillus mesophilus]TMV43972.1 carbohydrate ABC transporter substrate-binding protein [Paenibacillus mesophilus]